jgi:hypothetical protein
MEKVTITLELTHDEVKYVLDSLKKRKEVVERIELRQKQSQSEPRKDKHGNTMIPCNSDLIWPENALFDLNGNAVLPDPQPFQLEYGKRYKASNGKIYGPLVENKGANSKTHPFKANHLTWKPDGIWGVGTQTDELDLIEEVI